MRRHQILASEFPRVPHDFFSLSVISLEPLNLLNQVQLRIPMEWHVMLKRPQSVVVMLIIWRVLFQHHRITTQQVRQAVSGDGPVHVDLIFELEEVGEWNVRDLRPVLRYFVGEEEKVGDGRVEQARIVSGDVDEVESFPSRVATAEESFLVLLAPSPLLILYGENVECHPVEHVERGLCQVVCRQHDVHSVGGATPGENRNA